MGTPGVTARAVVLAIICTSAQVVDAGVVTLDNGLAMADGWTNIQVDDYGSYGRQYSAMEDDEYFPPGTSNQFTPTFLTGAMLFMKTPGKSSRMVLTDDTGWTKLVEPPNGDGIVGTHAGLALRLVSANTTTSATETTSAFAIEDTANDIQLDVVLNQKLTSDPDLSASFDQVFRISNNGNGSIDLVMTFIWELDLYYTSSSWEDDVVGVGPGLCYVYQREPTSSIYGMSLGDGGTSTVPLTYYFAGKNGLGPPSGPVFEEFGGQVQPLYNNDDGIPTTWRNYGMGAGYNMAGEDPTIVADAHIGIEYRFTIAQGAAQSIHVRRNYGKITMTCPNTTQPGCGNGMLDTGEPCDGDDTPTCNGGTCAASACGDGYYNALAEECESIGVDSDTCNGMTCTAPVCGDGYVNTAALEVCDDMGETAACNADCTPAACGDGVVNAAAAEECETGELCDVTTCTYAFTLGGGCAGCGAGGDAGGVLWLGALAFIASRRRRR